MMGVFVKGMRQYYLLNSSNIRISLKENIVIYISGLSLIFTPNGIGEMIKSKFFKDRHKIPIKKTLPIIMMELYHELLGVVTIIAVTILFYNSIEAKIALFFGSFILILIYTVLRYHKKLQSFKRFIIKIKLFERIIKGGEESQKSLYLLTSAKKMSITWLFTIVSMVFELSAIYLIFRSFGIYQLDFILESQLYLTSLLLGQISFLPNGVGITDVSFIGMLSARKLDLASATAVVLVIRFIGLWFKTSIGFIAIKIMK